MRPVAGGLEAGTGEGDGPRACGPGCTAPAGHLRGFRRFAPTADEGLLAQPTLALPEALTRGDRVAMLPNAVAEQSRSTLFGFGIILLGVPVHHVRRALGARGRGAGARVGNGREAARVGEDGRGLGSGSGG
jgi:hypothetical protein